MSSAKRRPSCPGEGELKCDCVLLWVGTDHFSHILQGYFFGTVATAWLQQWQWNNHGEYGWINHVYGMPKRTLILIFWYRKIFFDIRNWFSNIRNYMIWEINFWHQKINFWYQKIITIFYIRNSCIFWYQKFDFLISFADIRNSDFLI